MSQTYTLNIAGLTRKLPLLPISTDLTIASFVMLGDAQLTHAVAKELVKKIPTDCQALVTLESKGIPLTHELALLLGHDRYVVLRKSIKSYMQEPLCINVQSITTTNQQKLVLDKNDATFLAGKKVVLVDDVISTGGSLAAATELLKKANVTLQTKIAVLAEGDANKRTDISYLEHLPLFNASGEKI